MQKRSERRRKERKNGQAWAKGKERKECRQTKERNDRGREGSTGGETEEVGTDWWVEGREYRIFSIKKTNHRLLNNFDLHLVLTNF